jgi:hypothetical protein
MLTAVALLALLLNLNGTVATASSKNANLDGTWLIVASDGNGNMVVSNENLTTGSFGGALSGSGVSFTIIAGQVTGNSFTMTIEVAGTVVGEHGEQIDYRGTVNGNKMTITSTASRAWDNGKLVKGDSPGTYHGTRKGSTYELTGEIILQCDSGGASCPANGEPFEGLTVNVTGDNGSASDTTNDDGMWSVKLPEGTYTITPTDPDITFQPLNADIDLDANTMAGKFSACASGQTSDSPQLMARRPMSAQPSVGYSLRAINCTTSEFSAVFNPKDPGYVSVKWLSSVQQCETAGQKKFVRHQTTRVHLPLSKVTLTRDGSGVIVGLTINSPKPNPRFSPIVKLTVNPGYTSGSVTLNGSGVAVSDISDGTDGKTEEGDVVTCTPMSGTAGLAPGPSL